MNSEQKGNSSKYILTGIAGAIGGLTLGYWLNSKNGQKWRSETKETVLENVSNAQSTLEKQAEALRVKSEQMMQKGEALKIEAENMLKEKVLSGAEKVDEVIENTSEIANSAINELSSKTKSAVEIGKSKAQANIEGIRNSAS